MFKEARKSYDSNGFLVAKKFDKYCPKLLYNMLKWILSYTRAKYRSSKVLLLR